MADDLDDFLKQAALRRQQRQQQQRPNQPAAQRPAPVQPPPPIRPEPPRLRPEVPRLQPEIPTAQVVEYTKPYEPTVGNLSSGLPSSMPVSVTPTFDSQSSANAKDKPRPKQKKGKGPESPPVLKETPATAAEPQQTAKVSAASLVSQLRDPQTLRMAIIAHEIMKRPWQ